MANDFDQAAAGGASHVGSGNWWNALGTIYHDASTGQNKSNLVGNIIGKVGEAFKGVTGDVGSGAGSDAATGAEAAGAAGSAEAAGSAAAAADSGAASALPALAALA